MARHAVPDRRRAAVRLGDPPRRPQRPPDRTALAFRVPDRDADARDRQCRRRLGGGNRRHRDGVADHRVCSALDGAPRPRRLRAADRTFHADRPRHRLRGRRPARRARRAAAGARSCSSSRRSPGRSARSTRARRRCRAGRSVAVGMQMLAAGLVLIVFASAKGEVGQVDVGAISLESWLGFAYLIVAGSLVAFTAYMWLLRNAPTSLVATYAYVNPVVAVLLGTVFLGEPLGVAHARRRRDHRRLGRDDRPHAEAEGTGRHRSTRPVAASPARARGNLNRHDLVRPPQRAGQVGRGAPRGRRGRDRPDRARRRALRRRPRAGPGRARGHARLHRLGVRAAPRRCACTARACAASPTPSSRRR